MRKLIAAFLFLGIPYTAQAGQVDCFRDLHGRVTCRDALPRSMFNDTDYGAINNQLMQQMDANREQARMQQELLLQIYLMKLRQQNGQR